MDHDTGDGDPRVYSVDVHQPVHWVQRSHALLCSYIPARHHVGLESSLLLLSHSLTLNTIACRCISAVHSGLPDLLHRVRVLRHRGAAAPCGQRAAGGRTAHHGGLRAVVEQRSALPWVVRRHAYGCSVNGCA